MVIVILVSQNGGCHMSGSMQIATVIGFLSPALRSTPLVFLLALVMSNMQLLMFSPILSPFRRENYGWYVADH